MTTVSELITYLETLPQDTSVGVAVNVDNNWSSYTSSEVLELPIRNKDGSFEECSNNLDFSRVLTGKTFLFFGRT